MNSDVAIGRWMKGVEMLMSGSSWSGLSRLLWADWRPVSAAPLMIEMRVPFCSRDWPSMTTSWPSSNPFAITAVTPSSRWIVYQPSSRGLVGPDHIHEKLVLAMPHRREGSVSTPLLVVSSNRELTNWPGQSCELALGNVALSLMVPVAGSIALSTVSSSPGQARSCYRWKTLRPGVCQRPARAGLPAGNPAAR